MAAGSGDVHEIEILGRKLTLTDEGLEYEVSVTSIVEHCWKAWG